MISHEHKFIFVHIAKTAGNALQGVLRKYSEDEIVLTAPWHDGIERFEVSNSLFGLHKHSTLAEYRAALGRKRFGTYKILTCVRNPWDRAISHYFSAHRGPVEWNRAAFIRFLRQVRPVSRYLRLPFDRLPGRDWTRNADVVMRFESLESDFRSACGVLGIPYDPLPTRNVGLHDGYARYYDAELRDRVGRRFRDEITRLGYKFDDARVGAAGSPGV